VPLAAGADGTGSETWLEASVAGSVLLALRRLDDLEASAAGAAMLCEFEIVYNQDRMKVV
jgi:hypothetical protein